MVFPGRCRHWCLAGTGIQYYGLRSRTVSSVSVTNNMFIEYNFCIFTVPKHGISQSFADDAPFAQFVSRHKFVYSTVGRSTVYDWRTLKNVLYICSRVASGSCPVLVLRQTKYSAESVTFKAQTVLRQTKSSTFRATGPHSKDYYFIVKQQQGTCRLQKHFFLQTSMLTSHFTLQMAFVGHCD